jgi:hypothetical protein
MTRSPQGALSETSESGQPAVKSETAMIPLLSNNTAAPEGCSELECSLQSIRLVTLAQQTRCKGRTPANGSASVRSDAVSRPAAAGGVSAKHPVWKPEACRAIGIATQIGRLERWIAPPLRQAGSPCRRLCHNSQRRRRPTGLAALGLVAAVEVNLQRAGQPG